MYKTTKSSKSKPPRWGDWTDWIWNEDYQRYYRQRQDAQGTIDTEWHEGSASTAVDAQTPRDTGIDDLTHGFANLQTAPTSTYDARTAEYAVTGGSRSKPSKAKSSNRHKGKQRAYSDDEEDTEREDSGSSSRYPAQTAPADNTGSYYDASTGQYYSYPVDTTQKQQVQQQYTTYATSTAPAYGYSSPRDQSNHYATDEYGQVDEDPDLQEAIADSRKYNYSSSSMGEASNSAYTTYDYEEEGPSTPKAHASHISATDGSMEQLDTRYRVEHSSRFQPGEIFKVLWSEPQGTGNEGAPSVSDRHEFRDKFGGKFFVGFRRFVVIANDQGHCTCVPILTYGGKGCKKRGVKPEKHGIIYERGQKARLLSNEPKLGFAPAKVDITMEGEKLSKESRVNYSKLVTVEHNVKVFFIGNVTPADWEIVSDAVNRCWEEKIHHKRKHFR